MRTFRRLLFLDLFRFGRFLFCYGFDGLRFRRRRFFDLRFDVLRFERFFFEDCGLAFFRLRSLFFGLGSFGLGFGGR